MTRIINEEWQKRFPVLEMELTKQGCKVSLADDKAHLEATLPPQLIDALFTRWQSLQTEAEAVGPLYGRWYTGQWNKHTVASAETREQQG